MVPWTLWSLCRDTAGQERFHTITTSYYRGAMVRLFIVRMVLVLIVHIYLWLTTFSFPRADRQLSLLLMISNIPWLMISIFSWSLLSLVIHWCCWENLNFDFPWVVLQTGLLWLNFPFIFPSNSEMEQKVIKWVVISLVIYFLQGIMLVYDITQEKTFDNISKWLRNIEEVILTRKVFFSTLAKLMACDPCM